MLGLETRIASAESFVDRETAEITDRASWEWYAESCSCGLPPGECRVHPRGRPSQRPPAGDWRVWAYVAGRGAGKTWAGASWMQHRVEQGILKVGCLIAPTSNDIRDVMIEGQSGLLAIAPPWCRPHFESSKRQGGEWLDCPADGHPEEDMMDALRGGIRDALPEVSASAPHFPQVHASRIF